MELLVLLMIYIYMYLCNVHYKTTCIYIYLCVYIYTTIYVMLIQVEACELESSCRQTLQANGDIKHLRGDVFDVLPQTIKDELDKLEKKRQQGNAIFRKAKIVVEKGGCLSSIPCFCHRDDKGKPTNCPFELSDLNVSGSPCPNYSKAKHHRQGKEGPGAPARSTDTCTYTQTIIYTRIYIYI
jgi:hypothetical protein